MKMSSEGHSLYLAEATAISIIGDIDVDGNVLSGAIQARHKIREEDIKTLLGTCSSTQPGTCYRLLAIAYLTCYSSSAYSEIESLMTSKNMSEEKVTPHFGGGQRYLREACVSEPMNLWPGWGVENQKNNTQTLDQHMYSVLSINGNDFKMNSLSNAHATGTGQTLGQEVASTMIGTNQTLSGPLGAGNATVAPQVGPNGQLTRRPTPTSEGLKLMLDYHNYYRSGLNSVTNAALLQKLQSYMNHLHVTGSIHPSFSTLMSDFDADRIAIQMHFMHIKNLLEDMTTRGTQHYNDLIDQLDKRYPMSTDALIVALRSAIVKARNGWQTNRNAIVSRVNKAATSIAASAGSPFVSNTYLAIKF